MMETRVHMELESKDVIESTEEVLKTVNTGTEPEITIENAVETVNAEVGNISVQGDPWTHESACHAEKI